MQPVRLVDICSHLAWFYNLVHLLLQGIKRADMQQALAQTRNRFQSRQLRLQTADDGH